MGEEQYLKKYDSFIFQFDNVLYPEKDYLLQVYYLFAQFIEYAEQIDATKILDHMKVVFDNEGPDSVFDSTILQFGLEEKYRTNFDLLMQNAKLPLKLLLYNHMLRFLTTIAQSGKQIFLLAEGDPVVALNKIRQTEWNGLETGLIVYFADEFSEQSTERIISTILDKHSINTLDALFVGNSSQTILISPSSGINYLDAAKLLT
jgi:hypothetical protein